MEKRILRFFVVAGLAAVAIAAHGDTTTLRIDTRTGVRVAAATATAANGRNTVWQCYVLGLNPTNENSHFLATITIGPDCKPVVGFDPPRPAHTPENWYLIEGKEDLGDERWLPKADGHRFFRVKVDIPGE